MSAKPDKAPASAFWTSMVRLFCALKSGTTHEKYSDINISISELSDIVSDASNLWAKTINAPL
jgi:hypothetical protein